MLATNVLSRSVKVGANVAINFDLPDQPTFYFDRSSRVGRCGRRGVIFSFGDAETLNILERHAQKLNIRIQKI